MIPTTRPAPFGLWAALLLVAAWAGAPRASVSPPADPDRDWREGYTAVTVSVSGPKDVQAAVSEVQAAGGRIGVAVPPASYPGEAVLLGWVDAAVGSGLLGRAGIHSVYTPSPSWIETTAGAQGPLAFWRQVVTGGLPEPAPGSWPTHESDARLPETDAAPSPGEGGIGTLGTSDQMTGTVVAALFLVESNGVSDPDLYTWTPADSTTEVSGVLSAMSWWSSKAPVYGQSVTFTVVTYGPSSTTCKTKYEPALHTSGEVSLWVNEIMNHLGYTSGSSITNVRNFDTALRTQYGTNWAFSIFCGYNPPPAADSYTDGTSAWAYLGGPYLQTLFRSYGWTPYQVTSHEMGHIFGACDEYAGPCGCDVCTKNVINANCESCNPATVDCMMKANTFRLCSYTPGQIGWEPPVTTLVVDAVAVSDPPPANNDGGADAGETAYLTVTLRNVGNQAGRAVSGVLSSADPYVTVQTNSASYGDVLITSNSSNTYRIAVGAGAPVNHVANLTLAISGTGYSAQDTVPVVISPVRVLRVTPSTATNNGVVTLRVGGHHFLPGASLRIEKTGYPARTATGVTVVNPDSVTGQVDLTGAALFSWDVVVTNTTGITGRLVNGLYVTPPGPVITSVLPVGAAVNDSLGVTIKGLNFNNPVSIWLELGATKRFGTIVSSGPDSVRFGLNLLGLAPGTYDVVEQNFDTQQARLTGGFQVYPVPDLQAFSPEVVPQGAVSVLTLTGANFVSGATAYLTGRFKPPVYATGVQFDSENQLRATFNLAGIPTGSRSVIVQNPGGGRDSIPFGLQIISPPTAHVVHPNGGDVLTPGSQATVGWTAASLGNGLDHILVELSLDGGLTFGSVVATAGAEDTSAVWTVPSVNTDSARVRVVAYDVDNLSGYDDSDANFTIGSPTAAGTSVPAAFRLGAAGPRPARAPVTWTLDVPRATPVDAAVYDARGALVARLASGALPAGTHTLTWDGRSASGRAVASGVYVCRAQAAGWRAESRVLMIH